MEVTPLVADIGVSRAIVSRSSTSSVDSFVMPILNIGRAMTELILKLLVLAQNAPTCGLPCSRMLTGVGSIVSFLSTSPLSCYWVKEWWRELSECRSNSWPSPMPMRMEIPWLNHSTVADTFFNNVPTGYSDRAPVYPCTNGWSIRPWV